MAKDLENGGEEVESELAPGCRSHPGRVGFDEYRGNVAQTVGDKLGDNFLSAQEDTNWIGTASAPPGNLEDLIK